MRRDNRGLSTVELIIMVAILSVLVGTMSFGINMITRRPVEACAQKLQAAISETRVTTMGKTNTYLEIYMDEGLITVKKVYSGNSTVSVIGDQDVKLQYRITGDAEGSYRDLGDYTNKLVLTFDRSSGGFKDLSAMGDAYNGKKCIEIKISKGDTVKILKLIPLTGKVTME